MRAGGLSRHFRIHERGAQLFPLERTADVY